MNILPMMVLRMRRMMTVLAVLGLLLTGVRGAMGR